MFRRFKIVLIASCALLLMLVVFLQYSGHSLTVIPESLNHLHVQTPHINATDAHLTVASLSPQKFAAATTITTTTTTTTTTTSSIINPVPSDEDLQKMSHKDMQTFYHSYVNSPQVTCSRVERMGKLTDGGWELCDDPLYRPLKGDCLVYSYGINFDYSYDDDMAAYGCQVHAFDPSMNTAPYLRGERVFFHPSGVGAKDGVISAPKNEQWQLYTIGSHRKMLQQTQNQKRLDIVKMDVEGYELDGLIAALNEDSLSDVRQLAFETHVAWGNYDPTKEQYMKFLALLRKVYEKGFRIFVTHRNYVYSAFDSMLQKGKKRAYCHEIHTININFKNVVNPDGSVVGDNAVSSEKQKEAFDQQKLLLSQEQSSYAKRHFLIPQVKQPAPVPKA